VSGFSDRDRNRIRSGLVDAGRDQFARFGLDRTRIKDLTDAVGIAPSTFYQFFDSKERLYLEVLAAERERIAAEVGAGLDRTETPRDELRFALEYLFAELEDNELYYRLVVENEIESLHRALPEAALEEHYSDGFAVYEPHARRWTRQESFRIDDPAVVVRLFRMLAFTVVAGERFGGDYDPARAALIDALVDGLFG
jgi:AcrR family transcriptional regulator